MSKFFDYIPLPTLLRCVPKVRQRFTQLQARYTESQWKAMQDLLRDTYGVRMLHSARELGRVCVSTQCMLRLRASLFQCIRLLSGATSASMPVGGQRLCWSGRQIIMAGSTRRHAYCGGSSSLLFVCRKVPGMVPDKDIQGCTFTDPKLAEPAQAAYVSNMRQRVVSELTPVKKLLPFDEWQEIVLQGIELVLHFDATGLKLFDKRGKQIEFGGWRKLLGKPELDKLNDSSLVPLLLAFIGTKFLICLLWGACRAQDLCVCMFTVSNGS